jgi:hypothetical protein
VVFSCGGGSKSCAAGDLRCRCYPNGTCNGELVCLSDVCVSTDPAGEGGTGTGTGGRQGEGGTPDGTGGIATTGGSDGNTGGSSSEGGSPTEGGTPGTDAGAGGASTMGGSTDTGGSTTTGGKASTGGTGTTGGTSTSGGKASTSGGTSSGGVVGIAGNGATSGTPANSMILNGDFSDGAAHWKFTETSSSTSVVSYANGSACIRATYTTAMNLGYPLATTEAFAIESGNVYTISYRAAATATVGVTAKVGHATSPYTAVYQTSSSSPDVVSTDWQQYTHQFVASISDSGAGFVLSATVISGAEICFDDVSLVKE